MSKKDSRTDLDVRPIGPWFTNYDPYGPAEPSKTSPGSGLYSNLKRFKSVEEFLKFKRKKKRKKALLELYCKVIS